VFLSYCTQRLDKRKYRKNNPVCSFYCVYPPIFA
jgi:hypothetical protein